MSGAKKMRLRFHQLRAGICASGIAALSILTSGNATRAADTFDIGVSTALSPPGSVVQGVQARQALELVADWINEQGGVAGKKIKLIIADDQGTTEGGRTVAERLITRDKVSAITGQISSNVVIASLDVAKKYKIPVLNTNGWANTIRTSGVTEIFCPGPYATKVISATVDTLLALGVKSVYGTFDNTDSGFQQQKELTEQLKARAPQIKFKSVVLDRAGKDFLPAVLDIQSFKPDIVVNEMVAPAGYILMNQLAEQGVAPSKETMFFEIGGITDNPDFWKNVREAAKYALAFGHYHPKFQLPGVGTEFRARFTKRYGADPGRISFQAADSLLMLVDAAKRAGSTEPAALISALEKTDADGTRGRIKFDMTPGITFHQWVDVPYAIYQFTAVDQKLDDTTLLKQSNGPLDLSKVVKP
jgi:ABC-type branched-subunit amino acid transport system substrate-binding protein